MRITELRHVDSLTAVSMQAAIPVSKVSLRSFDNLSGPHVEVLHLRNCPYFTVFMLGC